jgi:serine/threonine-protein kinase RsbW
MNATRAFGRRIDALEAIFAFTSEFFARGSLDPRLLPTVDLAVEELFTNMVKYGANPAAASEIRIALARVEGGVEVELVDSGVDAFDPTRAPEVDTTLPLEARTAGGLGLHLIRRLVDSWSYDYSEARRESRITFTKTLAGAPANERKTTTGVT